MRTGTSGEITTQILTKWTIQQCTHAFSTLYLRQRISKFILSKVQIRYVTKLHTVLITLLDLKKEWIKPGTLYVIDLKGSWNNLDERFTHTLTEVHEEPKKTLRLLSINYITLSVNMGRECQFTQRLNLRIKSRLQNRTKKCKKKCPQYYSSGLC